MASTIGKKHKILRRKTWKQPNPQFQCFSILMALEGAVYCFEKGIKPEKFVKQAKTNIRELREIIDTYFDPEVNWKKGDKK